MNTGKKRYSNYLIDPTAKAPRQTKHSRQKLTNICSSSYEDAAITHTAEENVVVAADDVAASEEVEQLTILATQDPGSDDHSEVPVHIDDACETRYLLFLYWSFQARSLC